MGKNTALLMKSSHQEKTTALTAAGPRQKHIGYSTDDDSLWKIILERPRNHNDAFVYAVRSTGIYCRPFCPSRRPRREQVIFFSFPEAAEQAGFRACKRCQPKSAGRSDLQTQRVRAVCKHIEENPDEIPTLSALASKMGSSPFYLQRVFKRIMGLTPRQYFDAVRTRRLKNELRSKRNVAEAMYESGYGSSSRLYEKGIFHLGMTPGVYRKGGAQMRIRFTIAVSSLGRLLVAVTEHGVCSVKLGDSETALKNALHSEYPAAGISRDDEALRRSVKAIIKYIDGRSSDIDLPIDVKATAFQWRVWKLLLSIPYGETRSYAEIADAIGQPRAARAVARACASNPVALLIPCHRVVHKDGTPSGYRWGEKRKRLLLSRESRH
ncbi:MAG TPA: bifunctional DNA-binding transcriptional regulator/O6-methylguanine-DNA methyltransferase Ada [Acidobacteriota bacterium]|nr:bifunctional DNA-binding transcriptional regulator/O6-methylguanine-DNA methyltransferase Ada [Acidobacteriota bacterium]